MKAITASILAVLAVTAPAFAAPGIEVNRPVMDFEEHVFNANGHVHSNLWIFNRGTTDLHIGDVGVGNPPDYPFDVGPQCANTTIPPSGHCELDVEQFMGELGSFEGDFDIESDDPDEPTVTVTTRGRIALSYLEGKLDGIAPPAILRCVNFTNKQIVQQALTDTSRWDCLAAGLEAADRDEIKVTIRGRAEADTLDALPGRSGAPRADQARTVSPDLVVDPLVVDMGVVDVIQAEWGAGVLVTNDNAVPITFSEVATTDPLAEPLFVVVDRLSHNTCNPGVQCEGGGGLQLGLRALVPGVYSDTFSITSNDPVTPNVTVQVRAEVVADRITLTMVGLRNLRHSVRCWNKTTQQQFIYEGKGLNCTQRGLRASANDRIFIAFEDFKED